MNPNIFNDNFSCKTPFSRINKHVSQSLDGQFWYDGEVLTPNGIVSIYSQNDPSFPLTRLDYVINGRLWMRTIQKHYSKQYIVTLANRFTKEISRKYKVENKKIKL